MKSRVLSLILLASSAAACAPHAPPAGPAPRAGVRDADVPPVLALLSERERLSLTPAQVTALDSIARAWDVENQKLARQLGAVKTRGPRLALALAARPRMALTAVAENNRRAVQAVEQVLSARQRQELCQLQRARYGKMTLRADKRGLETISADSRPDGARSLVLSRARRGDARRVWPWCSAPFESSLASAQTDS